jgi:hypothetical protein
MRRPPMCNRLSMTAKQMYSLYGHSNNLEISEPWGYNRLSAKT